MIDNRLEIKYFNFEESSGKRARRKNKYVNILKTFHLLHFKLMNVESGRL